MAATGGSEAIVLGIDPGSRRMGWAIVSSGMGLQGASTLRRIASGAIVVDARLPLPERLGLILRALEALFATHACTELAVESAFVKDNPRTALVLGQARGLPIALAAARGMPVHEYAPALVKRRICGSGRAEKGQMREMVKILLGLPELPGEDEADALAVAVAHVRANAWGVTTAAAARPLVALAKPVTTSAQALWLAQLAATSKTAVKKGSRA
jgi:crossover junction endodeoxyribonuclease RuvC